MPLTDVRVRGLKPKSSPYKVSDGAGLYVLVNSNGSKLWRFGYRFAGKQKVLAIGAYPTVTIIDARLARENAKKALGAGQDPSAMKQAERWLRKKAGEDTFGAVARRWHAARKSKWNPQYRDRVWQRFADHILPDLGAAPISAVEPPTLLKTMRKIEARGTVELAHRCRNYCGQVFRYAIAEGLASRDPSADIREALSTRPPVTHRAALRAKDLPAFMAKLSAYDGEELTQLALRLALLTFVRTHELRFAARPEFEELYGNEPLWRIPADRMKGATRKKREHLVPLSTQAVAVVRRILEIQSHPTLLFAANTRAGVISENTMLYALYRLGYHSRGTVHGFRSTASTILNENGFNRDWIERQLAHVEGNNVRAAYNAAEWLPQRRKMMQWWADYLDQQADVGELVG